MGKGSRDKSAPAGVDLVAHGRTPTVVHNTSCSSRLSSWLSDGTVCLSPRNNGKRTDVGTIQLESGEGEEWVMDIPDLSKEMLSPLCANSGWVSYEMEKISSASKWLQQSTEFRLFPLGALHPILSAQKKNNAYLISAYPSNDLQSSYCVSMSWNMLRTEFYIHGRWCAACEPGSTSFNCSTPASQRQDLGAIIYEKNWKGNAPRQMHLVVPPIDPSNPEQAVCMCPLQGHPPLADSYKNGQIRLQHLLHFTTRQPTWNAAIQRHELNFSDRVTMPSVHNFQLVDANHKEHTALQFGKADKHSFALDARFPLSPIQAFACAIASFEAGSLCT
uniref:Tubby C-terminal domain-containing protein n=1 Tax=Pyramimonas obovata TaxID=1411642 RepID=A0A7S0QYX4_9CHLO|mmetsp:Transcript_19190/g.41995  ORF Transcript_19190/g.41995 Transcript_19190/m.41995 type:complete len:332 (+) Transcript_19190:188-1183(+)